MEEILNTMRATQSKKNALGKARAMEKQLQAPQLMDPTALEPTTDAVIHGKGGGEAGMKRVIGNGKRGRPAKVAGASNGVMEGGAMTSAKEMGAKIAKQIASLHGKDFADQFHQGIMDELKGGMRLLGMPGHGTFQGGAKKRGGAGPISAPPSGLEVSHAMMSPAQQGLAGQALGGQDVPPGGLAPVAYGSVPQAPASFKRNTVGMGRASGAGKKMACGGAVTQKGREDEKLGMEVKGLKDKVAMVVARKKAPVGGAKDCSGCMSCKGSGPAGAGKKKSSARGQMISKLMKEKGMTLGQASKYLKENP